MDHRALIVRASRLAACGLLLVAFASPSFAQTRDLDLPSTGTGNTSYLTDQPAQMTTQTADTEATWRVRPLLTVGEDVAGYRPVGILDGTGARQLDAVTTRVWVNHEVQDQQAYPYTLANGLSITGARVSWFDLDRRSRTITGAGLAYDTIIDRYGQEVVAAAQINEGNGNVDTDGFERFCAANFYDAGEYDLVDGIFFTGEETGGGQECALDVSNGVLHVAPALGRAAWESVCLLDDGNPETVVVLVGDDRAAAPLLLYVGQKDAIGDGSFLDRNGLAMGTLHVWVADDGSLSPEDWNGTGTQRSGRFVAIDYYRPDLAGTDGWDLAGWADQSTQDALSAAAGAFQFSRPEDVATDPLDGSRAVLASTGRGSLFPSDNWGTTYIVDVAFGDEVTAQLTVAYDGDDAGNGRFDHPDHGLRSPDNLEWADDGLIYLQEDRSTSPGSLFGSVSGVEASLWALDPATGALARIAVVDRNAVPEGQQDNDPTDLGDWETSGVLDVTSLFPTRAGETLLLATVQGHSLVGESLGGANQSQDLVQGGQLLLLSGTAPTMEDDTPVAEVELNSAVLEPNAPNPFNPQTTLSFRLEHAGPARLSVYNAAGRLVRTLADGHHGAGRHSVIWDGRDQQGSQAASGVYLYRLETQEGRQSGRMLMIK